MLNFILALLPSFLNVPIRRLLGAKIGKSAKIRWGTLIRVNNKKLNIGNNTVIGPFAYVAARQLTIGSRSIIKPLAVISTAYVEFADYTHIASLAMIRSSFSKKSKIVLGKHGRVFPFCWLDTGEGIFIGDNVGLGGHTLIFTHGSWPDYLDGGPVSFGPVTIEDNVWIPWRVFILPGVTIGANSVIGANSTVNKSLPARVLAAGSPAKILKEDLPLELDDDEKLSRTQKILQDFAEYLHDQSVENISLQNNNLSFGNITIWVENSESAKSGDMVIFVKQNLAVTQVQEMLKKGVSVINHPEKVYYSAGENKIFDDFIFYIRKYGVRLEYR